MADFRLPGPLGGGIRLHIDGGTLARTASALPGVVGFDRPILDYVRREIHEGLRRAVDRGVHLGSQIAYNAAMRELEALRDDVNAKLRYLAGLPEDLKKQLCYELYAAGFSHYLPKKFLRRYIWGGGGKLTLTKQEMIDCNPLIDLRRAKGFNDLLAKALTQPGRPVTFELPVPAGALTNGTLGQFTTRTKGTLVATAAAEWQASGQMSFYDFWDFDAKDFSTGGRSPQGELKTRMGSLLPGQGFDIESESAPFEQGEKDKTVVWEGGTPTLVPDRIAGADQTLSKAD